MAPGFKLMDQDENWVALSDLIARGPTMIAFYPGDFTPVCTKQLCGYQEAYDRFVAYGVQVVGISTNDPESHQKFKSQFRFTFPLLSDPDRKVAKAYNVNTLFLLGGLGRAVFVVDKGGKIVYRYVEPTPLTHRNADEVLKILDGLKAGGKI